MAFDSIRDAAPKISFVQYLRTDKRKTEENRSGFGRRTIANRMYLGEELVGLWRTAEEKAHFFTHAISA